MHLRFSLAAVALLGMCSSASVVRAYNGLPDIKQGATAVALVDVGYLIQNHPTMKGEMESIKQEMAKAQEEIETRRQELVKQGEQVNKTYDSASADFKQKQEELINKESRLRVDFMEKEKEFSERHAGLMAKSYRDITESIEYVATNYKFDLVLRYSKEQEEMDPKKPRSVEYGIQKDVLYRAQNIDVTPHVMYVLSHKLGVTAPAATQQATAPSAAGQPAAQTANRPAGTPARPTR